MEHRPISVRPSNRRANDLLRDIGNAASADSGYCRRLVADLSLLLVYASKAPDWEQFPLGTLRYKQIVERLQAPVEADSWTP